MNETTKREVLERAKTFFAENIVANHKKNLEKLTLSEFNVNPFLEKYLACFAFGDASPINIARALVYPRILGTSIVTTFGTQMQKLCLEIVVPAYASKVSGMDIEFKDHLDGGRHKYCQLKSGPNILNKDDTTTVSEYFQKVKNLARTNGDKDFNVSRDCIVATLYGEKSELSGMFRVLEKDYTIYPGRTFWHSLTGDPEFYDDLIKVFEKVAFGENGARVLETKIEEIAGEISQK